VLQCEGNLCGESFLQLGTPREEFHDPIELGETHHHLPRNIGNVGTSYDGNEMMLTKGVDFNIPDEYDLI
jgi:hypothetical protein